MANYLKKDGPVALHLRAIFEAGWNESQLDVRALIQNTSNVFLRGNNLHRSLLSTFIVLGLLGTLFGLADALSSLDVLTKNGELNSAELNAGLKILLGSLKSAFAPSI